MSNRIQLSFKSVTGYLSRIKRSNNSRRDNTDQSTATSNQVCSGAEQPGDVKDLSASLSQHFTPGDPLEAVARQRAASIAHQKAVQTKMDEQFVIFQQSQQELLEIQSEYLNIGQEIQAANAEMRRLEQAAKTGRGDQESSTTVLAQPTSTIPSPEELLAMGRERAQESEAGVQDTDSVLSSLSRLSGG